MDGDSFAAAFGAMNMQRPKPDVSNLEGVFCGLNLHSVPTFNPGLRKNRAQAQQPALHAFAPSTVPPPPQNHPDIDGGVAHSSPSASDSDDSLLGIQWSRPAPRSVSFSAGVSHASQGKDGRPKPAKSHSAAQPAPPATRGTFGFTAPPSTNATGFTFAPPAPAAPAFIPPAGVFHPGAPPAAAARTANAAKDTGAPDLGIKFPIGSSAPRTGIEPTIPLSFGFCASSTPFTAQLPAHAPNPTATYSFPSVPSTASARSPGLSAFNFALPTGGKPVAPPQPPPALFQPGVARRSGGKGRSHAGLHEAADGDAAGSSALPPAAAGTAVSGQTFDARPSEKQPQGTSTIPAPPLFTFSVPTPPPSTVDTERQGKIQAAKVSQGLARDAFSQNEYAAAHKHYTDALNTLACVSNHGIHLATLHGNRAACAIMLRQYADALEDTRQATLVDKGYLHAYGRRARAFIALGELHSAFSCLHDIVREVQGGRCDVGKQADAWASIRELHTSLETCLAAIDSAVGHLKRHSPDLAVSALDRAKYVLPDAERSVAWARVAVAAWVGHKHLYQQARELCVSVLPDCLEGSNAHLAHCDSSTVSSSCLDLAVLYSWVLWSAEEGDAAERVLQAVLRANSKHTLALALSKKVETCERYRKSGNRAYASGNWEQALSSYQLSLDALRVGGTLVDELTQTPLLVPAVAATMHSNKAAAYSMGGGHADAVTSCTAALSAWPEHTKARLRRARARVQTADFRGARQDYSAVLTAIRSGQSTSGKGGRTDATAAEVSSELHAVSAQERAYEAKQAEERRRRQKAHAEANWSSFYEDDGYYDSEDEDAEQETSGAHYGHGGGRGHAGSAHSKKGPGGMPAPPPKPMPAPPRPPDHWTILGVPVNTADAEVLKAAYRRAALKTHPDKGGSAEAFKAVALAYEVLQCRLKRSDWEQECRDWDRKHGGRR